MFLNGFGYVDWLYLQSILLKYSRDSETDVAKAAWLVLSWYQILNLKYLIKHFCCMANIGIFQHI